MNRVSYIIIAVVVSIAVQSCTYDNEEDLLIDNGGLVLLPDTVSFSLDVQPLLAANCNQSGCHAAGTGPSRGDLTTYAGVKSKVDNFSFEREVIINRTMPQNARLRESEIQLLQKWLDQGALNN